MDPFSPIISTNSGSLDGSPRGNPDDASLSPEPQSQTSVTSAINESRNPAPTVPAACLACRGKHLKCDGLVPCGRCRTSNCECVYVASRRGYKGPRKNPPPSGVGQKRPASSSPSPSTSLADSCPMLGGTPGPVPPTVTVFNPALVLPEATPRSPAITARNESDLFNLHLFRNQFASSDALARSAAVRAQSTTPNQPIQSFPDRCFEAFFYHFHAAHPFVLPKNCLLDIAKTTPLDHLMAAIRYIGSLYIDCGGIRPTFFEDALRLAYEPTCLKDGFFVQTLLLLLIGLDGSCQQEKARQLLAEVERAAVNINLNTKQYASINGRGNPVLEESWRRTWWDLYVVDGMIAGVHRQTNFILFDVIADVALPCEEQQYLSGNIPPLRYLNDLDDQLFSGDDREFSSFAYRIAATRNLGRFMRLPQIMLSEDENISHVESWLTNWRMHLPNAKRNALSKSCKLDEMMFQAIMITNATSILLHQPHSQLDSSPVRNVVACAPHRAVAGGAVWNTHTLHTLQSAKEISKMVTQAVPMLSHTHFFTCVVTLSSIVHLSKWGMYFIEGGGADEDLRQQIRLNIGALNKLSEVWAAANTARDQVKGVAQEIYRMKKANQANAAFWVNFTQDEIISNVAADESIMSEFDTVPAVTNILT